MVLKRASPFFWPSKESNKENSWLRLLLLMVVLWVGLWLPNQTMPVFAVNEG